MSSIITKGYGVKREAIVTQGYGRRITEIVVDAIEEAARLRVGNTKARRKPLENGYVEYTISASIENVNNQALEQAIRNKIHKKIKDFDANVSIQNISFSTSEKEIKIEVRAISNKTKKSSPMVKAKIIKK